MTSQERLAIAVVDDDGDVRRALERLLRSMGHDVRVFASAEEFDAQQAVFDCLILDLRLPGLSGLELSERLALRGSRLPVVLITGDSEPLKPENRHELGHPLLAKPFSAEELIEAIARAMSAAREPERPHMPAGSTRG